MQPAMAAAIAVELRLLVEAVILSGVQQHSILPAARHLKPVHPAPRPQNPANTPLPHATHQGLSAAMPQTNLSVPHALCAPGVHAEPGLAAVIVAWPALAETVRATILQLIATEEVR